MDYLKEARVYLKEVIDWDHKDNHTDLKKFAGAMGGKYNAEFLDLFGLKETDVDCIKEWYAEGSAEFWYVKIHCM